MRIRYRFSTSRNNLVPINPDVAINIALRGPVMFIHSHIQNVSNPQNAAVRRSRTSTQNLNLSVWFTYLTKPPRVAMPIAVAYVKSESEKGFLSFHIGAPQSLEPQYI